VFEGQVTFRANFADVEFESIEIASLHSSVSKAILKSSFVEGLLLEVEIAGAGSIDAALQEAREVAFYIAKVMTFEFGLFHQAFRLVRHSIVEDKLLPDENTKGIHYTLVGGCGTGGSLFIWKKLDTKHLNNLKNILERKAHPGFFHYEHFYFAISRTDPLSKFMTLYSLVLTLCNDKQEDVDKFVLSVQPTVATTPPYHSRKSGVPETVYTRLRNQVGHVRPGTTIEGTISEMEANMSDLVIITKELISRQH
jgi:hypothetical protein